MELKNKFERYLKQALDTVYSEPDTPYFHTPIIHKMVDLFVPMMDLKRILIYWILDVDRGHL